MDVAALIIATLALILGLINLSIMLAKNFFSTHVVQLQPVEAMTGMPGGRPMQEAFHEIGDPLTDDEQAYFDSLAKPPQSRMKPGPRAI